MSRSSHEVDYVVGLDLGPAQDYSALAILERRHARSASEGATYALRHLQRFPLGMPYTAMMPAVTGLLDQEPLHGSPLVVDYTGVGRALIDMLRGSVRAGRLIPVTITAGIAVTRADGGGYCVPKKELVTCLQLLLQGRRLKVPFALPEGDTLVRELENFRMRVPVVAADTSVAWRERPNDDLVLALAVAAWWAERPRIRIGGLS